MNSLTVCLLDKFYPVPTQTVLRPDDQLCSGPNLLKAGYCLVMMIILSDCGDNGGGGGGGYVAGNAGIDDHGSSESRK